tara:strand:- start:222 stop:467 length:246 start_codon:yes stop_codon:yes gene_type:complete
MKDDVQIKFLKELGNHIKSIRKKKKMSQSEVANLCGKERQSYQRVESGNINPTVWYLQHIAISLEVELKDLLDVKLPKPKV